MKRLAALMVAGLIAAGAASQAYASEPAWRPDPIYVTINGVPVSFRDQQPESIEGRTLVPVADVFRSLGFVDSWDGPTKTVSLKSDAYQVYVTQDSPIFTTNGVAYELDVPAQNILGLIMVPMAALLRTVGYDVGWDNPTRTVVVVSQSAATEVVVANYADFPTIPDLGSFMAPPLLPEMSTEQGGVVTYWYKGITAEAADAYAAKLAELGFAKDAVAPNVYADSDYSVTIDMTSEQANGYSLVQVREMYENFPGAAVPSIQGYSFFNQTAEPNAGGDMFWYADVEPADVTNYINLLAAQGYKSDANREKEGYYVYVNGDNTVVVDTVTQASNRYVLVTVKDSIAYYHSHPTVPVPPGAPDRQAPADDGSGTTYSYVNNTEINVQGYITLLTELEFEQDTELTGSGRYVYAKDDITVILDTNSVSNYVLLTILDEVEAAKAERYYPEFPEIPAIAGTYTASSPMNNSGYDVTYWYTVLDLAGTQSYVQLLDDMGYDVDQKGSVYTCVKDGIIVTIDAVSVKIINTNATSEENDKFYEAFDTVPNLAYAFRKDFEDFLNAELTLLASDGSAVTYRHVAYTGEGNSAGDLKDFEDDYLKELDDEGFVETEDGYLKNGVLVSVEMEDYDLTEDVEGFEYVITIKSVEVEDTAPPATTEPEPDVTSSTDPQADAPPESEAADSPEPTDANQGA